MPSVVGSKVDVLSCPCSLMALSTLLFSMPSPFCPLASSACPHPRPWKGLRHQFQGSALSGTPLASAPPCKERNAAGRERGEVPRDPENGAGHSLTLFRI